MRKGKIREIELLGLVEKSEKMGRFNLSEAGKKFITRLELVVNRPE
jgi:hypothetical protein